jgi:hypothetical protein
MGLFAFNYLQNFQREVAAVVARTSLHDTGQVGEAKSFAMADIVVLHHVQRHVASEDVLRASVVQRESIKSNTEVASFQVCGAQLELTQMIGDLASCV